MEWEMVTKTWWEIEGKQPGAAEFSYAWWNATEVEDAIRGLNVLKARMPDCTFRRVKVTQTITREAWEAE